MAHEAQFHPRYDPPEGGGPRDDSRGRLDLGDDLELQVSESGSQRARDIDEGAAMQELAVGPRKPVPPSGVRGNNSIPDRLGVGIRGGRGVMRTSPRVLPEIIDLSLESGGHLQDILDDVTHVDPPDEA